MFPLVFLLMDVLEPGAGLIWVRARPQGSGLFVQGAFHSGASTPILLWGHRPFTNPCIGDQSPCCLVQASRIFRNDLLASNASCSAVPQGDLVQGSMPGVQTTSHGSTVAFSALVPRDMQYVAMLFVGSPFWAVGGGQMLFASHDVATPCYRVEDPYGVPVCMYCTNGKPYHSDFIYTPSWFVGLECDWKCQDGYEGGSCFPTLLKPAMWPYVIVGMALLVIGAGFACRRKDLPPPIPDEPPKLVHMVQFKDEDIISQHQIRVKIS